MSSRMLTSRRLDIGTRKPVLELSRIAHGKEHEAEDAQIARAVKESKRQHGKVGSVGERAGSHAGRSFPVVHADPRNVQTMLD